MSTCLFHTKHNTKWSGNPDEEHSNISSYADCANLCKEKDACEAWNWADQQCEHFHSVQLVQSSDVSGSMSGSCETFPTNFVQLEQESSSNVRLTLTSVEDVVTALEILMKESSDDTTGTMVSIDNALNSVVDRVFPRATSPMTCRVQKVNFEIHKNSRHNIELAKTLHSGIHCHAGEYMHSIAFTHPLCPRTATDMALAFTTSMQCHKDAPAMYGFQTPEAYGDPINFITVEARCCTQV